MSKPKSFIRFDATSQVTERVDNLTPEAILLQTHWASDYFANTPRQS